MNPILCTFGIYLFQKCLKKTFKLFRLNWLSSYQKPYDWNLEMNQNACINENIFFLKLYVSKYIYCKLEGL